MPRLMHLAWASLCTLLAAIEGAPGQDWVATSAPSLGWQALASSADGTTLAAAVYRGPLYISTDSGVTWIASTNLGTRWHSVACSADGATLAVGGSAVICTSTNFGTSWRTNLVATPYRWAVTVSATGTRIVAVGGPQQVCISTNSGATWATNWIPLAEADWIAVAGSANGTKLIGTSQLAACVSTNGGTTWTSIDMYGMSLACSASGSTMAAAHGGLSLSTNSGATWTSVRPGDGSLIFSIACSADGTKMVAGGSRGSYISNDSGVTWLSNNAPRLAWQAVASSADGSKLVAAASLGGIYTWQAAPVLGVALSSSSVVLSWPVLSSTAGFVLQQCTDLAAMNWGPAPASPIVTNGHNQVTLSRSAVNTFYRLSKP